MSQLRKSPVGTFSFVPWVDRPYCEPQALWISGKLSHTSPVLNGTSPDLWVKTQDSHMTSNHKDSPEVGVWAWGGSREGTPREEEPSPLRQSTLRAPTKAGKSAQMRFKHSVQCCKSTPLP